MALLTSDGAAKLADKGRQSEVSISCITLSQNITINVGDERIAYEIQADAEVQCLETAQALPLLAAPRGLSLTESAVRITAAPENMEILNPFCVSKIGNVYTLTVPSAWEQEDAMLQISIKLYFSTVVRRSRSTLAYYTQIPVLLSVKNSLKCTFHGFEGSPDAPPTLGTEPPMSCLPIWSTLNGMMQLQGTFPSTDILALQWGQPVEQGSEPPMFGNAALCECSMDIALERVWSEAYHDYALRSTLTFQFEVTIATPRVSLLVKESILYCELDGTDEELVLDSLEIEADSSIIARHELSVTTELDMNSKALVRVAGRVSNAPRKFALVVNVDAVCGMFGDPPASPLRFCVRGKAHTTHAYSIVSGILPRAYTLPFLRFSDVPCTSHTYAIQRTSRTSEDNEYQLKVARAESKGSVICPIEGVSTVRIYGLERCTIAYTRTSLRTILQDAEHCDALRFNSVNHEVWPIGADGKRRMEHRILMFIHGPLSVQAYTLLLFPKGTGRVLEPFDAQVRVNGYPATVFFETEYVGTKSSTDVAGDETTALRFSVPSMSLHGVNAQVEVTFTLAWTDTEILSVIVPSFPSFVPVSILRVHGVGSLSPRLVEYEEEAHLGYTSDAYITRFAVKPCYPSRLQFVLQRTAQVRHIHTTVLWMVFAILLVFAAIYMYICTKSIHQLSLRVNTLAMALDVDFADGSYKSATADMEMQTHASNGSLPFSFVSSVWGRFWR